MGALLVGVYENGKLKVAGRVGTCMLTAACDRNTVRDALVKLPDSTTATKVRNKSISSSGNMDLFDMLITQFSLIR
jgi:hypothetical protein